MHKIHNPEAAKKYRTTKGVRFSLKAYIQAHKKNQTLQVIDSIYSYIYTHAHTT